MVPRKPPCAGRHQSCWCAARRCVRQPQGSLLIELGSSSGGGNVEEIMGTYRKIHCKWRFYGRSNLSNLLEVTR